MTTDLTTGLLAGLALAALLMLLAGIGLRGGALRQRRDCRLVCPRFRELVDCTLVQDVRTGQWQDVLSCGAFLPPGTLLCDRECARAMNLGFTLGGPATTSGPAREVGHA